jgi:FixJ family two-component response regulator
VTTNDDAFTEAYETFKPTTIVLDMIMPGMDGNKLVLWLADKACAARLVFMTGYTPDYAAHAKLLAKYKGLRPVIRLSKPFELSALRAILAGGIGTNPAVGAGVRSI